MAQQVGELVIRMAADVAQLKADMAKAHANVSQAMQGIEKAVSLAKTAFIAFTGVASVNAFKNMVQGSIESAAKLHDLAIQGQTTVEALSGLASIGKLSDTSAQQVVGAMNKMAKGMAGATEDSKGAGLAIKALGINYDAFVQQAPDQQMMSVAKAMDHFKDGAGKAAVAQAVFGKEGAALLPFLQDLARTGELQAKVTKEQAAMADNYTDNLTKLQAASNSWQKQLSLGVMPALYEASEAALSLFTQTGGLKDEIVKLSKDGTLANWARQGITGVSYLLDAFIYAKRAVQSVGQTIGAAFAQAVEFVSSVGSAIGNILHGQFGAAVDDIRGGFARMAQVGDEWKADQLELWGEQTLGSKLRGRLQELKGYTEQTDKGAKAALNFRNMLAKQDSAKLYEGQMQAVQKFIAEREAELEGGQKLTAGQKLEIDVRNKLGAAYDTAISQAVQLAKQRDDEATAQERLNKWLAESADANAAALEAARGQALQAEDQLKAQRELGAVYGLTAEQTYALETAKIRDAAATLRSRKVVDDFNDSARQLNEFLDRQAQAFEATAAARDEYAAAQRKAATDAYSGAQRGAEQYLADISRAGDATAAAVSNAARGMEDALTNFFATGKLNAKAWVQSLISEFMRLQVVRPMMADMGGGLFGVASFLMSGGQVSATSSMGLPNVGPQLPGLASGGPAMPGQLYQVNEVRPELLTVGGADYLMMGRHAGRVTPLADAARAAPGGGGLAGAAAPAVSVTVPQTITVQAGADRAMVMQAMQTAQQATMAAIADQIRRGNRAFSPAGA